MELIYGYENKYLNLCTLFYERYGWSFVVSANSVDSSCALDDEIVQIEEHVEKCDEIIFIGVSNDASVGAQQCWKVDKINSALLINGPLMINWHKTKKGAEAFECEQMSFVYGDQDLSYKYVGLLNFIENDACQYTVIEGEGHCFSDYTLENVIFTFLSERMETGDK